jgi:predicted PurR-regulated permease PerM
VRTVDPQDAMDNRERITAAEASYVEKALGLVLLLVLAIGCIYTLAPFLKAIFLAIALCVSTWSLFRKVTGRLGRRTTAAALLMTLMIAGLLVLPLLALGANLTDDVARLTAAVRSAIDQGLPPPGWLGRIPLVGREIEAVWLEASQQGKGLGPALSPYAIPLRDWALRQGGTLLSGTLQVAFGILLAFFFYRDGAYVERRVEWAMARLGGLLAFGIIGVFLGPVLLAVAYTLFQDWGRTGDASP